MTTAALPDTAQEIADDEAYLGHLVTARAGVAQSGFVKVADPTGTEVEYKDISVLDRRITEVRARLNLKRRRLEGHQFVGMTYR